MSEQQQRVAVEGADIDTAVQKAAAELGVPASAVVYEIDKDWFRNEQGGMVPRSTVQIHAWAQDASVIEACDEAREWLEELFENMEIQAKIQASLRESTVVLNVDAEKAGIIVGKQGRTIEGIRHLLVESLGEGYPDLNFRINVVDNRPRPSHGDDREDGRRSRGDRDRSGGDRGRSGGRRERGGRGGPDSRNRTSDSDARALESMAVKIAARVLESGCAEQVKRELNSFDRRIVHTTIAEIDGVTTRSIGDGSMKTLEVILEAGSPAEA